MSGINRTIGRVLLVCLLVAVVLCESSRAQDAPQVQASQHRASWMEGARWGVMTHYLADWRSRVDKEPMSVENWNKMIDEFDVEGLAEQVKSVGAGYYLITIGQGSGYYLAPNETYDKIVKIEPSHCSRRDLVSALYPALHKRNIRLMVYLGGGGRGMPSNSNDARRRESQEAWYSVIRDWSLRFGTKVDGWWFDGCYFPNRMYRFPDPPNFKSFAEAARAGNPNTAVAFNPGVIDRALSITPHEDYIGGEINYLDRAMIRRTSPPGYIDGAKVHYLSFLGQTWGMGAPRYTAEQVADLSRNASRQGATLTWDTPIQKSGLISEQFMEQLTAIGKALKTVNEHQN